MIKSIKKLIFVFFIINILKVKKNLSYKDLNFRKNDFTNYQQIKTFIFKDEFHKQKNKYVNNFDFLNFSKKLGGKIGINLSKKTIFEWYKVNKFKLNFPWVEDLSARRLINLLYNYEYVSSSSTNLETDRLNKIIYQHILRVNFDFKQKKIGDISSYDILAYILCCLLSKKLNTHEIDYVKFIISYQIDGMGMHKSYNILEHSKFINNLNEIKSIILYFNIKDSFEIDEIIVKMTSVLIQYFHEDGTLPLFNGSNNNFTKNIYNSLNKEIFFKKRSFTSKDNGIAYYFDKEKKVFFDVVQPNKDRVSSNLSAGTLSFEISCLGEKIITNCGASESFGKNPEYLRYSAAHSTIILQNTNISEIKDGNPHIRYPQLVEFERSSSDDVERFEGSHNGYVKKFRKIIKRKLIIDKKINKISGIDSIISVKENINKVIYHIRFHLSDGITYSLTNNKKNIILKTKLNNIWLFKSDIEIIVEDSILVDLNITKPIKQIVLKGIINENKLSRIWSLEKV